MKKCSVDGKPGYKWGDRGHCYTYKSGDEASEKAAKKKAFNQGIRVEGSPEKAAKVQHGNARQQELMDKVAENIKNKEKEI